MIGGPWLVARPSEQEVMKQKNNNKKTLKPRRLQGCYAFSIISLRTLSLAPEER
jgi:hypothetical protein